MSSQVSIANTVAGGDLTQRLVLETELGRIVIDLDHDAAPTTIDRFVALVQTPDSSGAGSVFDGTTIDYTNPRVEIRIKAPDAVKDFAVPKEINADALGLDKELIANIDQATDQWDMRILKYWRNDLHKQADTPLLQSWLDQWDKDKSAAFLIGTSEQQVLGALGHEFVTGVASRPVTRGSVLLKPESVNESGPVITIALADIPERNGDWTVIGNVSEGLDLAEAISIRPSTERRKPRWQPLDPVEINHLEFK